MGVAGLRAGVPGGLVADERMVAGLCVSDDDPLVGVRRGGCGGDRDCAGDGVCAGDPRGGSEPGAQFAIGINPILSQAIPGEDVVVWGLRKGLDQDGSPVSYNR